MRTSHLMLVLAVLAGCPATDDDDVSGVCPVEDRFSSDPSVACQENVCGSPQVWPATGASADSFTELADGDVLPVTFGIQGGYHIDLAARMVNLCAVVWLDFELFDTTGGTETLIHTTRRHVQAVRENTNEEFPSQQRWWVEQFRFPCAWWPDDPDHEVTCPDPVAGRIDEVPLLLRISAEDHNVDENEQPIRTAVAEAAVRAECCRD